MPRPDPPPPRSTEPTLPYAPEAEAHVIGAVFWEPAALATVAGFLAPEDFFEKRWQDVYRAMLALDERRETPTRTTVAEELGPALLEEIGGPSALAQVWADSPTTVGVEYSGRIIQRKRQHRQLIEAAGLIAKLGYDDGPDFRSALGRAEALLLSLHGMGEARDFVALRSLLDSFMGPPEDEDAAGDGLLHSGFAELDKVLGGLRRSDLVVLAARPAVGKSALALSLARNIAIGQGGVVAFFSLEMSAEQVAARLVSAEAEVSSDRLPWGRHTDEQQAWISRAVGVLSAAEIYIDDTPGSSVTAIRAKARRLAQEGRLDLIVVDHMQLVHGPDSHRFDNRVAEMSYISRSLKELARELETPVLALSQLSRAIESRPGHTPLLSDLRESGSIEQDADVVVFIHRPDIYAAPAVDGEPKALSQLIVAKHRHGPVGTANVRFYKAMAKFEDLMIYTPPEPATRGLV